MARGKMYLFFPLTLVRVCYFRDPTKLKTPTRHIMNLNFWTFVPKHEKKSSIHPKYRKHIQHIHIILEKVRHTVSFIIC